MRRFFHPLFPVGLLALCTVLFVAACGASSGTGSGGEGGDPEAAGSSGETGGTSSPEGTGNPTLGSADAPVLMVEWGDFQ